MSTTAIWGEPPVSAQRVEPDWGWFRDDDRRTYRELRSFLQDEIRLWRPDLIVVYERKGTAIFRCLIESRSEPLEWTWKKVISSSALDQLSNDVLRNSRLLVFDDMVRTAKQLNNVGSILRQRGVPEDPRNVRFVAFAAHEDSTQLKICGRSLDSWFYRDLTTQAYTKTRERIVRLLQSEGSLMLDTEHLEVRITLRGGFNRLIHSLRRKATPIEFRSGADRTNITIYYGDDPSHKLPAEWFPEGTGFTDIVKKCRLVQREDPDEFAIIPICLPAVPLHGQWPDRKDDKRVLGDVVAHDERSAARFYAAALLGSLKPLEWILKDLYTADPQGFGMRYPSYSNDIKAGLSYSLEHLNVMYPTLNVDALVERIIRVGKESEAFGQKKRGTQNRARTTPTTFSNDELHKKAMELLQVIRHTLDERRSEIAIQYSDPSRVNSGLRAKEIFDLSKRLDWGQKATDESLAAAISTLFDILIDDAKLVTRVEILMDETGCERWTRTFKPDGEVVSDLVRDYTAQWGLPRGF